MCRRVLCVVVFVCKRVPCYHPITAFQAGPGTPLVFSEHSLRGRDYQTLSVPCRHCIGCRLEYSRQWAVRCMHEASLHEMNCFLTLTFDDEHYPDRGSLSYKPFQDFMKRLRKFAKVRVRFYGCGEYGETLGRPHYHVCIFGFDFRDKKPVAKSGEFDLYESESLARLWPLGRAWIGEVTFESAAYVARYIVKKVNGDLAKEHYARVDLETGEVYQLEPEFSCMSLKPGIGAEWFAKYQRDVFPHDFVVTRGSKAKPPRYYDVLYERVDRLGFDDVRQDRALDGFRSALDNTFERLEVKEQVALARQARYSRRK